MVKNKKYGIRRFILIWRRNITISGATAEREASGSMCTPRFYIPFRVQDHATVEPSIGLRGTGYRLDKNNFDDQPDTDRWSHRELFDTRLELFTEFERVFNLEGQLFERIKHRIRPQITHEFIPDSKQGDLPRFDTIDRIDETNKITYSLINTLTSKTKAAGPKTKRPALASGQGSQRKTTVDYQYNDFFRLEAQHSYDFEKSFRPFSPILTKLDVSPAQYIWIDADAQYSVYENELLSHNIQGSLWDKRGDELYVDYRYEKKSKETENNEDIQSILGKIKLQLTDYLSINAENQYNLETDQRIRTAGGFTYTAQCWSFDFKYTDEPNDWKVNFKIVLTGLGEIEY